MKHPKSLGEKHSKNFKEKHDVPYEPL